MKDQKVFQITITLIDEDAHEELLNLSPSELKNLLHHILSGKEFRIDQDGECLKMLISFVCEYGVKPAVDQSSSSLMDNPQSQLSVVVPSKRDIHGELYKEVKVCNFVCSNIFHFDDRPWTWATKMKSQIVKDSGVVDDV